MQGAMDVSVFLDREADLELIAGLEAGPEYVLIWTPPWLYGRPRDRLLRTGFWELLTVAEFEAGVPARDDWSLDGPPDPYLPLLAAWVKHLLGFPVALEPDETEIRTGRPLSRWHRVPLYWVRRNT
jgi:hypothetical protein